MSHNLGKKKQINIRITEDFKEDKKKKESCEPTYSETLHLRFSNTSVKTNIFPTNTEIPYFKSLKDVKSHLGLLLEHKIFFSC